MSDAIERMKAEAHLRTVEAHKYKPELVLREERVGNWIVTIEMAGGGVSKICKIYNANSLEEHYRYFQTISCCCEDAPEDIKAFYQKWENDIFNDVCNMAAKWQSAYTRKEK